MDERLPSAGEERRWRLATLALLGAAVAAAGMLLAGCASEAQPARPVDADAARTALKTALDRWKQAKPPASLRDGSPPITVQDKDWDAGARLVDYRIVGEGEGGTSDLKCQVTLTLRPPQGKAVKKDALYTVHTGEKTITVLREFFPAPPPAR